MSQAEIAIWSASIGVFAVCFVSAWVNAAVTRSIAGVQAALFILMAWWFVASCSGWLEVFTPFLSSKVHQTSVLLSGPIAGAVAMYGLSQFIRAHHRDAIILRGMQLVCAVSALSALAVLWPSYTQALESVAIIMLFCSVAAFWLVLRAALLGDRFAWPMVAACFALLLMVMGLYATALGGIDNQLALQALSSVAAAAYLVGCTIAVWRRNDEYLRMRRALSMHREKDLLTQLWTGAGLVRRVDQTIARAQRNRKETAIICVEIFNANQLRQELGVNALEQVIFTIAARLRRSVGSSTEVGRYDDNSFVVIVEGVKQPSVLRPLGLRVAAAVRRPVLLHPYSTSPRDFRCDVGVGVARLPATREARPPSRHASADTTYYTDSMGLAQESMHEASQLANSARSMPMRAAITDTNSRKPVALESAQLR